MRYDFQVTRAVIAFALLAGLAVLAPAPVAAEIYRYTDAGGNSYYVEGLENVPQEYRARAVPLGPGTAPGAPKPGGTSIKYTPGQRIMVDVKVNGTASANLLLDTGADKTMINPRVLVAAGAAISRPVGSARITGVAGADDVSFVVIDSLEVGEARVGRMQVASYDVAGAGDGLLGRDFLDRFSVNIDSANGVVTLSPK